MRTLLSLASLALIASAASAQSEYSNEPNTYRYGATYNTVGAASAASCAAICAQDRVCKAWSFQKSTRALGPAKCELQGTIGPAVNNPLMISGINPLIASQGQATVQRRIPAVNTLRGAPVNVVRNSTASSLPAAPRALIARPNPTPQPLPQARQRFTPPPPAPIQSAAPRQQPAAPLQPSRIATPGPAFVAPATPTLPTRNVSAPPPRPPAPIIQAAPPPPPPAAPIIQSAPTPTAPARINVPVTQGTLPPNAIIRDTAPPQVSFTPLGRAPVNNNVQPAVPAPPPVPRPTSAGTQVTSAPVTATTRPTTETATYPRRTQQSQRAAPKPITTAPAGSIPPPAVTEATPYNRLINQERPSFSVNKSTALTPEELALEQAAAEAAEKAAASKAPVIIDKINLDGGDLASEVGAPLGPNRLQDQRRARAGGGGS